jgi:hypothetical protein
VTSLLTTQRERLTEREVERQWNRDQGLNDLERGYFNLQANRLEDDAFDLACLRAAIDRIREREDV